ncbi:calcium-binding protein [Pseudooceanicola sp.]|uniref:calcium-binding protein n=1 Tax=Pseudooceanicola sp. TaxID=1914328 RepID=UPI00405941F2
MPDIIGTEFNDDGVTQAALVGTEWDDSISGLGGNDVLQGLAGNDVLDGGDGADTLEGGSGSDTILGSQGDRIVAGIGDDLIYSTGLTRDTHDLPYTVIYGGEGTDVYAGFGDGLTHSDMTRTVLYDVEVLDGSAILTRAVLDSFEILRNVRVLNITTPGSLNLDGRVESVSHGVVNSPDLLINYQGQGLLGSNVFVLTDIEDRIQITGSYGGDLFTTGAGDDAIYGIYGSDTIRSGDGADSIEGGNGDDILVAWGSTADVGDLVRGNSGNDWIEVGPGDDSVYGDLGQDTILGGMGDDLIYGGYPYADEAAEDGDSLDGGEGDDTIHAGAGNDLVDGGAGNDLIFGDANADRLFGLAGDDTLSGDAGNDLIAGSEGNDVLSGGDGADSIQGGAGDDRLSGGAFGDVLYDGDGLDFVNGGYGNDRINLADDGQRDVIYHQAVEGHGSDWVRGFAAEDALQAPEWLLPSDFLVQQAHTDGAGAGDVDELFITYAPNGQILWALVDGGALDAINLVIGGTEFDLLG